MYTNLIVWVKETTGGRKGSVEFWMGIPFLIAIRGENVL